MQRAPASLDAPIEDIGVSAHTVPTDSPEADGTYAWEKTTLVLVAMIGAVQMRVVV
jgi:hypothetical protein